MGNKNSICCAKNEREVGKRDAKASRKRKLQDQNSHYSVVSFKERHKKDSIHQINKSKNSMVYKNSMTEQQNQCLEDGEENPKQSVLNYKESGYNMNIPELDEESYLYSECKIPKRSQRNKVDINGESLYQSQTVNQIQKEGNYFQFLDLVDQLADKQDVFEAFQTLKNKYVYPFNKDFKEKDISRLEEKYDIELEYTQPDEQLEEEKHDDVVVQDVDEQEQQEEISYEGIIDEVIDIDVNFEEEGTLLQEFYYHKYAEAEGKWDQLKEFFEDMQSRFTKLQENETNQEKLEQIAQFQFYLISLFQAILLSSELNQIYDFKKIKLIELNQKQIIFETYRHKLSSTPRIMKFQNFDTNECIGQLQILDIMYNEMIKATNKPCCYTYQKVLINHNSNQFIIVELDQTNLTLDQFIDNLSDYHDQDVEFTLDQALKIFEDLILFLGLLHKHNIVLQDIQPHQIHYMRDLDQWIFNDFNNIYKIENCNFKSMARVKLENHNQVPEHLLELTTDENGDQIQIYNPFKQNTHQIGQILQYLINLVQKTPLGQEISIFPLYPIQINLDSIQTSLSSYVNSIALPLILKNFVVDLLQLYKCIKNKDFSSLFHSLMQEQQDLTESTPELLDPPEMQNESQPQEGENQLDLHNFIKNIQKKPQKKEESNEENENESDSTSIFNLILPESTIKVYYDDRYKCWHMFSFFSKEIDISQLQESVISQKSNLAISTESLEINEKTGVKFTHQNLGTMQFESNEILNSPMLSESLTINNLKLEIFLSRPKVTPMKLMEKYLELIKLGENVHIQIISDKIMGDGINLLNALVKNMNQLKFNTLEFTSEKALDYILSKSASIKVNHIKVMFDNEIQLPLLGKLKEFNLVKSLSFTGSHMIQDKNWWGNWNTVGVFSTLNNLLDQVSFDINSKFLNMQNPQIKPEEMMKLQNIVQNLTKFTISDERFPQCHTYKLSLQNLKTVKLLDPIHFAAFLGMNSSSTIKNSIKNVEHIIFANNRIYDKPWQFKISEHEKTIQAMQGFTCDNCSRKFGNLQKTPAYICQTSNKIYCEYCIKSEKAFQDMKNKDFQEWVLNFQNLNKITFDISPLLKEKKQAPQQKQQQTPQNNRSLCHASQIYSSPQKNHSQIRMLKSVLSPSLNLSRQISLQISSQIKETSYIQTSETNISEISTIQTQAFEEENESQIQQGIIPFNIWFLEAFKSVMKNLHAFKEKNIKIEILGTENCSQMCSIFIKTLSDMEMDLPEDFKFDDYFIFTQQLHQDREDFEHSFEQQIKSQINIYRKEQEKLQGVTEYMGQEEQIKEQYQIKTYNLKQQVKQTIPTDKKKLIKQFSHMLMKKIVEIPLPNKQETNAFFDRSQMKSSQLCNSFSQSFFQSIQEDKDHHTSSEIIKITQSGNFHVSDLLKLDFLQKYKVVKQLSLRDFDDTLFSDILSNIMSHSGVHENLEKLSLNECFINYASNLPQLKQLQKLVIQNKRQDENSIQQQHEFVDQTEILQSKFQVDFLSNILYKNLKTIRLINVIQLKGEELSGINRFIGENTLKIICEQAPNIEELVLFGDGTFENLSELANLTNLKRVELQTNNTSSQAYVNFFEQLPQQNQLQLIVFKDCNNMNQHALQSLQENNYKFKENLKILGLLNQEVISGDMIEKYFLKPKKYSENNELEAVFPNLEQLIFENEKFEQRHFEVLKPLQKVLRIQFRNLNLQGQFVSCYLLKQEDEQSITDSNLSQEENANKSKILKRNQDFESQINKKLKQDREKNIHSNIKLVNSILGEQNLQIAEICTKQCDNSIEDIIFTIISNKIEEDESSDLESVSNNFTKQIQNLDRHFENNIGQKDPIYSQKLYKIGQFFEKFENYPKALVYYIKCDKVIFYSNNEVPPIFGLDYSIGKILLKQNRIEEGMFSMAVTMGMYTDKQNQQAGVLSEEDQKEYNEIEETINEQLEKLDYFKLLDILQDKYRQLEKEITANSLGYRKKIFIYLSINYLMEKFEQLKMFDLNCTVLQQINEYLFSENNIKKYCNRVRADHTTKLIQVFTSNKNTKKTTLALAYLKQAINYEQMAFSKSFELQPNFINTYENIEFQIYEQKSLQILSSYEEQIKSENCFKFNSIIALLRLKQEAIHLFKDQKLQEAEKTFSQILEKTSSLIDQQLHQQQSQEGQEQEQHSINFFFYEHYLIVLRFRVCLLNLFVNLKTNNQIKFEDNFILIKQYMHKLDHLELHSKHLSNNVYAGIAYYLKAFKLKNHHLFEAKDWVEKSLNMKDLSEPIYKEVYSNYLFIKQQVKSIQMYEMQEQIQQQKKDLQFRQFSNNKVI